jgi:hypothetical protein
LTVKSKNGVHYRLPLPGPAIAVVVIMDDTTYKEFVEIEDDETSLLDWVMARPAEDTWTWRCRREPGSWPDKLYKFLIGNVWKRLAGR